MSGNIFVSYRRADSRHAAGRLVDQLRDDFSEDRLFLDVDNIAIGLDFVEELTARVANCAAMLVVIGRDWLTMADDDGTRRLDDPQDFVRIEVEAALDRDIRVIPVLVDDAEMVREEDLPPSMAALARRQAVRIAHESFNADARRLSEGLAGVIGPSSEVPAGRNQTAAKFNGQSEPEVSAHLPLSHAEQYRPRRDLFGWLAVFSPLIFGALLFWSMVVVGLNPRELSELLRLQFGINFSGTEAFAFIPIIAAAVIWVLRLFRFRRLRMRLPVLGLVFAILWVVIALLAMG